jgi:hypothetical protein
MSINNIAVGQRLGNTEFDERWMANSFLEHDGHSVPSPDKQKADLCRPADVSVDGRGGCLIEQ